MEDYKKKYEEALEVIKENLNALNNKYKTGVNVVYIQSIKNCFYKAFPEIKGSENDRIRQDIITTLSISVSCDESALHPGAHTTLKEAITWLEEQGEQKPVDKVENIEQMNIVRIEDEHRIKDIIYFLDTAKKHYASTVELDACIDWLKSLRTHSTWKPSDEQMQALSNVSDSFRPFEEGHKILWSLYNDLKKLREE